MEEQLDFGLIIEKAPVSVEEIKSPGGYKGFYRFHKYWGKKPHEPLAYIIEQFSHPGDVVLDPFCGSGIAGREALLRSRRFIGFDINPMAIELTRLLVHPPPEKALREALFRLQKTVRPEILDSYLLEDGTTVATHYLFNSDEMEKVWVVGRGRAGKRQELIPTTHDKFFSDSFATYQSKFIRSPRFFTNSRINTSPEMTLDDLLSGRAKRNIDLLLCAIGSCPESVRPALKLCLTAASGQMTRMVFAVTGRGKTTGASSAKTEVGSWVIGYWRPKLHFEVNAWNCFEKRGNMLLKAIANNAFQNGARLTSSVSDVLCCKADAMLTCGDCCSLLGNIPDESVKLVITDPPHSDRMPYLELSELWNSILGFEADFSREIVVSNAKERGKTQGVYKKSMTEFLSQVPRVLSSDGILVLLFNASKEDEWEVFRAVCEEKANSNSVGLRFLGSFPCYYSARSVVQDNRRGSLKNDFALVFCRGDSLSSHDHSIRKLETIPAWSSKLSELLR